MRSVDLDCSPSRVDPPLFDLVLSISAASRLQVDPVDLDCTPLQSFLIASPVRFIVPACTAIRCSKPAFARLAVKPACLTACLDTLYRIIAASTLWDRPCCCSIISYCVDPAIAFHHPVGLHCSSSQVEGGTASIMRRKAASKSNLIIYLDLYDVSPSRRSLNLLCMFSCPCS